MSHLISKKQEEWNSQKVKELLRLPENKKCFDCPTKSPFFVNVSIQTFVCTRCSGLVREVGHRVKSISASKFSGPEIVALQHGGNEVARTIWLSNYNMATAEPETDGDVRLFMRQKYYEQKWLDREKGVTHAETVKRIITEMYTEDGIRRPIVTANKRKSMEQRPKLPPTQSWVDDNVPIGLIPAIKTGNMQDLLLNDEMMLSPKSPTFSFPSPRPSSSTNRNINAPTTTSSSSNKGPNQPQEQDDIFSQLAGLNTTPSVIRPSYSGGILQPNSPTLPTSPNTNTTTPFQLPVVQSQPKPAAQQNNKPTIDLDPYAALRDLSIGSKPVTPPMKSSRPIQIKTTPSDDSMIFGDFQKSPTTSNTNSPVTFNTSSKNALFHDLDPLFKK